MLDLLIILFLIGVNALYVAAEFAAVSVRHSQVQQLAQAGHSIARQLVPILQDTRRLDRYIAACQIGITLSSLVLGAYGQATIALDFGDLLRDFSGLSSLAATSTAATTVLILLTILQVVFGELVPKSLALQFPAQVAIYTFWPMRWSQSVYFLFIVLLNGSGLFLLRLLGMGRDGGHRHIHSPEEIEMLIAESRQGGLLKRDEQERLHHALQLGRRTARQLMVPRRFVQMVEASSRIEEIVDLAIQSPFTRLPVYQDSIDHVIGMLHTKELTSRYARGDLALADEAGLPKELLHPIASIPNSIKADQLLKILRDRRSRLAIVLDEFGGVEGVVALEDVLNELLGEIGDEFKGGQPAPEVLRDGRVRLPGLLRLDEAAEWTGVDWKDDEVDTVAGLVLAELERIPIPGERLTIDGVLIEVERMDGHAIASLIVTPKSPGEPPRENATREEKRDADGLAESEARR